MPDPAGHTGGNNLYPQARVTWAGDWPDLRPVTIVRLDRWTAFPLQPQDLPENYLDPGFLTAYAGPLGTADTPDGAYLDLAGQLPQGRHRRR